MGVAVAQNSRTAPADSPSRRPGLRGASIACAALNYGSAGTDNQFRLRTTPLDDCDHMSLCKGLNFRLGHG